MRQLALVLVAVGVAGLCGCGSGGDESAGPQTPEELIDAMSRHAYLGQTEEMVALMDSDARSQAGKAWLDLAIYRVAHPQAVSAKNTLGDKRVAELGEMPTPASLKTVQEEAPVILRRMFSVLIKFSFEEDGDVLVFATNEQGQLVWLAMERQSDKSLRLMSDAETKKVYDALGKKLQAAYREQLKSQQAN